MLFLSFNKNSLPNNVSKVAQPQSPSSTHCHECHPLILNRAMAASPVEKGSTIVSLKVGIVRQGPVLDLGKHKGVGFEQVKMRKRITEFPSELGRVVDVGDRVDQVVRDLVKDPRSGS